MKSHRRRSRKVEKALIAAHRQGEAVQVDHLFQAEVMNHIRRLPLPSVSPGDEETAYGTMVWQFAGVVVSLVGMLSGYFLLREVTTQYYVMQILLYELKTPMILGLL